MSKDNPKIITTFQGRLQIDAALRSLGEAANEAALAQRAAEIAAEHGEDVIPALLALLDTTNPKLRGGLGHLAASLEQDRIAPALSEVAQDRYASDQARMAAITILERFLGLEPTAAMYAGMAAPAELALQSLLQVLSAAAIDRLALLEYLEQLSHEPYDVLLAMVRATRRLQGADGVELLRVLAQDGYRPAAREALQILSAIVRPEAAIALQSLAATLPPDLAAQAERARQKLRLRGVHVAEPTAPPQHARCLASPPDSEGNQLLWFLLPQAEGQTSDLLQVMLGGRAGIWEATGNYAIAAEALPPALPLGGVHAAPLHEPGPYPMFMETPFDAGRRWVWLALQQNWANGQPTPLAYRLLNPLLWQWAKPEQAEKPARLATVAPEDMVKLLQHPAMSGWFLRSRSIQAAAQRLLTEPDATLQAVEQIVSSLTRQHLREDEHWATTLKRSLSNTQEWLTLAGQAEAASQAQAVAEALDEPSETHPFLLQLTLNGLRAAMIDLTRSAGGRFQP